MTDWLRRAYRWLTDTLPPPEFEGDDPPDWVVDISLRGMRANNSRIRGQLWPGRVRLVAQRYVFWSKDGDPLQEEWTGEQAAGLLRLVERAFAEPKSRQPCSVDDGMPTDVRLFRREPPGVVWQSWNLLAWKWRVVEQDWNLVAWDCHPESPEGLPPSVELVARLFAVARRKRG